MASVYEAVGPVVSQMKSEDESREVVLDQEFNLAGVTFNDVQNVLENVDARDEIVLVREPENPHDSHAVSVKLKNDGTHVGYVPKRFSRAVASYLDEGIELRADVRRVVHKGKNTNYGIIIKILRA